MPGLGCWGSEHPSAAHVTRTRGRSCRAPLHGNLTFPFCTPVPGASRSAHTCSWQDLTPSRPAARGSPRERTCRTPGLTPYFSYLGLGRAWRTTCSSTSRQRGWEKKKKTKLPRGRAEGAQTEAEASSRRPGSKPVAFDTGIRGSVWRRFWLSRWGCSWHFRASRDAVQLLPCPRQPPMPKDCLVTNVSGVEAGEPRFEHIASKRRFFLLFPVPWRPLSSWLHQIARE